MIKYNRNNHNFQIAHFIAGSCHTPDAAYIALLTLRKDREQALDHARVSELKTKAARAKALRDMQSDDECVRLLAEAELLEIRNNEKLFDELVAAGQDELNYINECIEQVQPLRKYAHLSDAEAAEASQAEEWMFELQYRAENYLITQGTIPPDHFATMRQHPMFKTNLLPHIRQVQEALSLPNGAEQYLLQAPEFDIPKLLERKE